VDTSELVRLAGITGATAKSNGDGLAVTSPATYRLRVSEPKAAVTSLLGWSEASGVEVRGLEVVPGSLEDVFLELTGRELRTRGATP
jgi:hypothetical protein